ncbi:progesterone binding protein [Schizosaccharomyces japonicus yFS275]|uniref:Progesterone binding protein n=1 Tax=Schizosaccharomyces japonicus (strain yFS275 / FY16936) TaxID=402676 RepID=B6JZ79_SCHJY|nr:progesterone binding protein [Schizosaccharomyces japonicus yFS275]EEB06847.1 progesterone binding protein [Schizosaccharomyces japonicus yFS275]
MSTTNREFSAEELRLYGANVTSTPTYVAVKGIVFDVSGNPLYNPGKPYAVFTGRDSSRALAKTSLAETDCVPVTDGLSEKQLIALDKWFRFFDKVSEACV